MAANPFAIYDDNESKGRLQRSGRRGFEIDAVGTSGNRNEESTIAQPGQLFSVRTIVIIIGVLFAIILGRVAYLQLMQGDSYRAIAEGNRINTIIEKSLRGVVTDRDRNLLVKNVPNFTLVLKPNTLPRDRTSAEYETTIKAIEGIAQMDPQTFDETTEQAIVRRRDTVLREHIPYEEALQLMIQAQEISGITIETFYGREYLTDESFGHLLGYTAKISEEEYAELVGSDYLFTDDIGKAGIEKSYESTLRGEDGRLNIEIDSQGKQQSIISENKPVAGHNIQLTIDSELQQDLYNQLKDIVDAQDLPGASAVALDPRNGSVLALVSYPSYSNNTFADGISTEEYSVLVEDERNPLFHRAVSGEYPSGSTFKPVVAAAGVQEGLVNRGTTVSSTGGLQIDRFYFPDWKSGGHGTTDVKKALAESVNTFFYLIGGGDNETNTGLGVDRITDYAQRFGFGGQTGIDMPGEASGFLPSKAWKEEYKDEPWYIGDTYHLAIGQGDILVTPLQIALMTTVFANNGTLFAPYSVSSTTDQEGNKVAETPPTIIDPQVVSPQAISLVREGLRDAVLSGSGSARSLQVLPVSSAGKTGTAQFGPTDKTHSWFTAFAPYESPEIAITVLVEEGGGGNDTALPVARRALQNYFAPEELTP